MNQAFYWYSLVFNNVICKEARRMTLFLPSNETLLSKEK